MTNKCEFVKKLHVNDTLKPKILKFLTLHLLKSCGTPFKISV